MRHNFLGIMLLLTLKRQDFVQIFFWIRMFLGLLDPDPLVSCTDPASEPYQNITDPQHCGKLS
jgi:hypothetical protein